MPDNLDEDKMPQGIMSVKNKVILLTGVLVVAITAVLFFLEYSGQPAKPREKSIDTLTTNEVAKKADVVYWIAPAISTITDAKQKQQVQYGKELIVHTAKYLGPHGAVLKISNGLNCQNCHLQAGTAIFANNYGSVASLYPKFRARSGAVENIYKRVNDCFERSLNGKAIDTAGKEMQAIAAYINFIGTNVKKGEKAAGSGFKELGYLNRAADPAKGLTVYTAKCKSCHQANGEGVYTADKIEFIYPALWGKNSFNDGAGLYRLSNIAKYVKYNMPQGTTYQNPQLSDEEAWDVAAFITTQKRPHISVSKDWPDKSKKPVDNPFGPYADNFPAKQHKLGPFKPIVEELEKKEDTAKNKTASAMTKKNEILP